MISLFGGPAEIRTRDLHLVKATSNFGLDMDNAPATNLRKEPQSAAASTSAPRIRRCTK